MTQVSENLVAAAAIVTSLGVFWAALRHVWKSGVRMVREIVRDELERYTRPIQPNYRNGGHSLADVAHNLQRIQKHLGIE